VDILARSPSDAETVSLCQSSRGAEVETGAARTVPGRDGSGGALETAAGTERAILHEGGEEGRVPADGI